MKALTTAALPFLLFIAAACGGEQSKPAEQRVTEDINTETGVISLRNYSIQDTIRIEGKVYHYNYALEHVDSMPIVINPQGLQYHESRVKINIMRNSTKIFSKTFYKNNFKDMVPADFLKSSTLVGVNYNFTKRDEDRSALYFIVTVGDPDETSDMVYPLELKVAPDGSFSIKKAENLETAPISTGLNIDPSEDAV